MGVQVIPIPIDLVSNSLPSHSHFCVLFLFPWDFHGNPIPIGNPIPMHISSVTEARHGIKNYSEMSAAFCEPPYRLWYRIHCSD